MNPILTRIAAAKTEDAEALRALQELEALARALHNAEASFPERINASKARRGEPPTQLSRRKREELAAFANDLEASDRELEQQLGALTSMQEVIGALHFGLAQDLPNAKKLLQYYHPEDRSLGEEIVAHKERLLAAMERFLETFPEQA